jgi:CDGSH-type Zn-finger protein
MRSAAPLPDGGLDPLPVTRGPEAVHLPAGVHHLCSCGRSRHGWTCDGAHLGTGRVAYELRLEEATTVQLCGCGRSHRYPLCDGRHNAAVARPWWRWWR